MSAAGDPIAPHLFSTAGMLVMLEAEFMAFAMVIIYAGAILVTYVFVIMLASQSGEALSDRRARSPMAACLSGFLLLSTVSGAVAGGKPPPADRRAAAVSVAPESGNTMHTEPRCGGM